VIEDRISGTLAYISKVYTTMAVILYATLLLALTLQVRGASPCKPSIEGCTCFKGTMNCVGRNITTFPLLTEPHDIDTFSFSNCRIEGPIVIPYANATAIQIRNSPILVKINESSFSALSKIEILSITDNHAVLGLTPSAFSNLTNLKSLELSDNALKSLPDGLFDGLEKLEKIDLSFNRLNLTESLFGKPSGIREFMCQDCELESIPKAVLEKLPNLTSLNLNQNSFVTLPAGAFSAVSSLKELSLDNCRIGSINVDAFRSLASLTYLNLGHNSLRELPQCLLLPCEKSLKKLYLENNKFVTMDEDRAPWKTLTEVKLGSNQWNCDCSIAWMDKLKNVDAENVTCSSPQHLAGKNLFDTEASMHCSSNHLRTKIVLGLSIPVILFCLLLIAYYIRQIVRNRHRQRTERHSFKYRSVYGDTVETNSKQSILA